MKRGPGQVSLERALSKLGIASRTVARGWIEQGKVKVNGVVRREPTYPVNPDKARIEVEGQLARRAVPRVLALHKPRGVVTTRADEKGRATIFELPGLASLEGAHFSAVGRLDWATSGLLLITNDTRLADWLTDPQNQVPRIYVVTVRGEFSEATSAKITGGIRDAGETLSAAAVTLRKTSKKESTLIIELREGKNREIRRLLAACGHEVTRLKRIAYGGITLGELPVGEARDLSREELEQAFPGAPIRASLE